MKFLFRIGFKNTEITDKICTACRCKISKARWAFTIEECLKKEYVEDNRIVDIYTGFDDKHGNKIFTGDILQGNLEVVFHTGRFFAENKHYSEDIVHSSQRVIIGNIYENPELLELEHD